MTNEKCPAYDQSSCTAQSGEWCTNMSGGGGWCATNGGMCPINDQATCSTKGRKWCASTSGGSGGWCMSGTDTCSTGSTPAPMFTWPQIETECLQYKGRWCSQKTMYSGGSCMMFTQTCPTTAGDGMMSCWDGSVVKNAQACPSMPTTSAECTKSGKNWCEYTTSMSGTMSGWCSKDACMKMPPAGQMTCPDGVSFGADLSKCPQKESGGTTNTDKKPVVPDAPPGTINGEKKYCPDGSVVPSAGTCLPIIKMRTCADGTKVEEKSLCPNELSTTESTKIQGEIKRLNTVIESLKNTFSKLGDKDILTKTNALKEGLDGITLDRSALDAIQKIQDSVIALETLKNENDQKDQADKDEALKNKALSFLKLNLNPFERFMVNLRNRITRAKRVAITVPSDMAADLSESEKILTSIKASEQYDQASELADKLDEKMLALQKDLDVLERNESINIMAPTLKKIKTEVARQDARAKSFTKQANGLTLGDELKEARAKLAAISLALTDLTKANLDEDTDPFTYLANTITDPLEDVTNDIDSIEAFTNLKKFIRTTDDALTQYDAAIKRMTRAKKALPEDITQKIGALKSASKTLKTYTNKPAKDAVAAGKDIVDSVAEMNRTVGEFLQPEKLPFTRALEDARQSSEKLQKITIPSVNDLTDRSDVVAYFLHLDTADIIAFGKKSSQARMSRLAQQ